VAVLVRHIAQRVVIGGPSTGPPLRGLTALRDEVVLACCRVAGDDDDT
jgi:hypothetical protein